MPFIDDVFHLCSFDTSVSRVNHASVALNNQIYMFGGYHDNFEFNDWMPCEIYCYNIDNSQWSRCNATNEKERREAPCHVYGLSAVEYEGDAWIWGGRHEYLGTNNTLYRYITTENRWQAMPGRGFAPPGRDGHSAVLVQHSMYISGGFEDWTHQYARELYSCDLRTCTWSLLRTSGSVPRPRDFHSTCVYRDWIILFGGRSDNVTASIHNDVYDPDVYVLDTRANPLCWRRFPNPDSPSAPCGRRSHAAFVYGAHMYVFAGYNSIQRQHFADWYRLDLERMHWERLDAPCAAVMLPSRRRRMSCARLGSRFFVFGGTCPRQDDIDFQLSDSEEEHPLKELNDMWILEFAISLKHLAQLAVIRYGLNEDCLPFPMQKQLDELRFGGAVRG